MSETERDAERGGVLIMALLFVTTAGLVVSGLVDLAGVNLRNTSGTRDQRKVVYAADSAVQKAINTYRSTSTCPAAETVNSVTVNLTCSAPVTTGSSSAPPSNMPKLAINTLPASGESGIVGGSNSNLKVTGGVYSATDIAFPPNASLEVTGDVYARSGCTAASGAANVTATGTKNCNLSGPYPDGSDPAYVPALSSAPPLAALPSCTSTGAVFNAGTYTDAVSLNSLFSTCAGRAFHFRPGIYYFEFTNAGTHEWVVSESGTVVVGGTLPPGKSVTDLSGIPVGSRCDKQSANGVQFIFGADSRLNITAGAMDLCASHDASGVKQEIAFFGLPSRPAYPAATAISPTDLSPAADPTGIPSGTFSSAGSGRVTDGTYASATVSSPGTQSITVGSFDLGPIPLNSTINSASAVLTHRETVTSPQGSLKNNLDLLATATSGAASASCASGSGTSPCLDRNVTATTGTITLGAPFLTRSALENLSLSFAATASKQGPSNTSFMVEFDGARLNVNYTPPAPSPAFHRLSGCATTAPYSQSSSTTCAVLKASGSQSDLALNGTVYAPTGAVDVEITNQAHEVFARGVIARTLWAKVTASCTLTCLNPPFQLPGSTSTPSSSTVVFQAVVNGNKRLRALVEFPTSGSPIVKSWSVVNES